MNGEGIMSLPGGGPTAMPGEGLGSLSPLVEAQNVTKEIGKTPVLRNLLDTGADIDPFEVKAFIQEIQQAGLTEDDMAAIREVVERVEAGYRDYPKVRRELLAEGAPEDLLPEQFDPEFFIALDIASEVPIGAGAPPPMMDQMPVQGFAQGGLASLPAMNPIAQSLAGMGRNGDTMLAHITPEEAQMLQQRGGSGTINPYTGLPEFFFKKFFKAAAKSLKSVAKAVKKFAKSDIGRIVIAVGAGMILGPAAVGFLQGATGVALSAAATTAITVGTGAFVSGLAAGDGFKNSLKAAVLSGATAYGGSALLSGGASMATPAAMTGPTSFSEGLSQGWNQTKSAVTNALGLEKPITPSAAEMDRLQQEAAIRQAGGSTGPDYLGTGDAQDLLRAQQQEAILPGTTPARGPLTLDGGYSAPGGWRTEGFGAAADTLSPGSAGYQYASSAQVNPYNIDPVSGFSPAQEASIQGRAIGQAQSVPTSPLSLGMEKGDRGFAGKIYDYFSPSAREAAGEQLALAKYNEVLASTGSKTLAEKAYTAALPGIIGKYGPLAAAGLGATAMMGGFSGTPAEEQPLGFDPITGLRPGELPFQQRRPDLFGEDRRLSSPTFSLTDTLVQSPRYSTMPVSDVASYQAPNMMTFQPGGIQQPYNRSGMYGIPNIYTAKKGSGPEGVTNFPRKTGAIDGPGTGTSDSIPAMLSDGEFVFTAKAVRNMGNGSRRKGAARMYKLMKMLEGGAVKKG
jgi:hypothetical protein